MYDGSARVSLNEGTDQVVLPDPHQSLPAPAASIDKIMLYKDYLEMDKYKGSHMKSPSKSYMKKDTDNVYSNISHPKSLIRQKSVIKFDNPHSSAWRYYR